MTIKKVVSKETAKKNLSVSRGNSRNGFTVEKEGVPLDHSTKQVGKSYTSKSIGMSKGATLNMGEYESLRVDCWLTDEVREGETPQEALRRLEAILDEVLEEVALSAKE